MIVDAHQHFWAIARGDYGWMEGNEAVNPIRRDFLPNDFEGIRNRFGIEKTVLVQAAPSIEETEYMLGLADAVAWIGKVVGWVDFEDRQHRRHLERFARHRKFAGVRPMIQDISDKNWMARDDVQWGYEAVRALDITFDALGFPVHLENFYRLFDKYPDMRTVIDHSMKPQIRNNAFDDWAGAIEKIAKNTPVYCKLSGLVTEAEANPTVATLKPYAEHVIKSFGADRVMWGSDWPVVTLAASYEGWWQMAHELVTESDAGKIFGQTASTFYRLAAT